SKKCIAFCPRPGTVLEDETVFETGARHEIAGALERLFGFAAKTDNEVARDRHPWYLLSAAGQHLAVVFHGVETLHSLENGVATRLRRHMQIRANFRQITNGIEQVIAHIFRKIRDKLDSIDAGGLVNADQKIGKAKAPAVAEIVFVAVDRLPQERHFPASFLGELADFSSDVIGMPALLRPAHAWYDAIGAEFVTTDHDPHVSLERRRPHGWIAERIVALEALLDLMT